MTSNQWSNWSGSVTCEPEHFLRPDSEAAIAQAVVDAAAAGRTVRVAGSGHSFTPLVASDGVLLSLENWRGIESSDLASQQVTVRAGTVLHDLGEPLLELGLAMANLGDIDVQALGGALGTGTHGTGPSLGNLSSRVESLRLVTASGEVRECSGQNDPELLRAARVSMGALGVLSLARVQLVPAYRLHERTSRTSLDACLDRLDDHIRATRHFEFFWYPKHDVVELKSLDWTEAAPDELPEVEGERIDWSSRILASVRDVKFNEMEYSVPAEYGAECVGRLAARIRERHSEVVWPVEYRTVASDDAYLSPAQGRETVTISVHQDGRYAFRDFFADVEEIFWDYGGRPHWGKVHTCDAERLRAVYPFFDHFLEWRRELDPNGLFSNSHLESLFGE
jgi:FAD/FMN-containing dehydrogenase